MTYPPVVYHGDRGEVTACFRRADTPPELTRPGGSAHFLATSADTESRFGLYRWVIGAGEGSTQPHFHRTFTESFFVLSGTLSLFDGARWTVMGAGDFASAPPGGLHTFRNESESAASLLLLFSPGVPIEGYMKGLFRLADGSWSPTDDELKAFRAEHDQHFPGD